MVQLLRWGKKISFRHNNDYCIEIILYLAAATSLAVWRSTRRMRLPTTGFNNDGVRSVICFPNNRWTAKFYSSFATMSTHKWKVLVDEEREKMNTKVAVIVFVCVCTIHSIVLCSHACWHYIVFPPFCLHFCLALHSIPSPLYRCSNSTKSHCITQSTGTAFIILRRFRLQFHFPSKCFAFELQCWQFAHSYSSLSLSPAFVADAVYARAFQT